jgi:hypothetical protein
MPSRAADRGRKESHIVARYEEFRWAPDYDKVAMAKFISSLTIPVPREALDIAERVLKTDAEVQNMRQERGARVRAERDAHRMVLDSDVKVDAGTPGNGRCRASRRSAWGLCSKKATHIRTWKTTETTGYTLDGVVLTHVEGRTNEDGKWEYGYWTIPGEWTIGKGFTERPLTEEEDERREPITVETVNTIALCGTHRNLKGSYGMPY